MNVLHSPKTRPQDYGFKDGDYHLIVNATTQTMKCFTSYGTQMWEIPCLATGQSANWWSQGGDTPPSVYKLGTLYNDKANGTMEAGYGWMFFDLIDCDTSKKEDGENTVGRAGIGLHGGGSSLPDPFAPYQGLVPTLGCVRLNNQDLEDKILPIYNQSTIYMSVYQDDE